MDLLTEWELLADGEETLEGLYLSTPKLPDLTWDMARVVQWIESERETRRPSQPRTVTK